MKRDPQSSRYTMHDGHIIVDGCDKCPCTVCVHCCRRGTLCKTWKAWSTGVTNVKDHNNSESGRDTAVPWMVIEKSLHVSMHGPTTRFKPLVRASLTSELTRLTLTTETMNKPHLHHPVDRLWIMIVLHFFFRRLFLLVGWVVTWDFQILRSNIEM